MLPLSSDLISSTALMDYSLLLLSKLASYEASTATITATGVFKKGRFFRTVPLLRFVIQKRAQVLPLAKTYALRIQNPLTLLAINANHEFMGQMPI